jgi:filamentous hemagglutinin
MQALLEHIHGEGAVEPHTLARLGDPNARLAGGRHPLTGVPFDLRGFPLFEKYVIFETRIGREFFKGSRADHMREATRHLRVAIDRGEISRNFFTQEQLAQIESSRSKIKDLTWHHHQELGRMQLLPEEIHETTRHVGGFAKWEK